MTRGRHLLRSRQRRVFCKSFRALESCNISNLGNDFSPFTMTPTKLRFIQRLGFACILCLLYLRMHRFSMLLGALYISYKRGIFSAVRDVIRRQSSSTQTNVPTIRQRGYYYIDYWLSTFPYAKAVVLLALTCCLILTFGSLISLVAKEPWLDSLWAAALGSGLDWGFVGDMKSTSSTLRFIALGTNVGGLVVTALLLSLISDAVQTKYDSMRKGSSAVTESGHTLIIGWSLKSLSVMEQLAKASESKGKDTIVVLDGYREKEDMELEIAQSEFKFSSLGTRVVCRSGSPLSLINLQRVSFSRARSILILSGDESDPEVNDASSLQILLAIVSSLEKVESESDGFTSPERVVIECQDSENAATFASVCPGLVEPVLAHDIVGRLLLQSARNPLVADVWQELLGFDGCETYSSQWGILRGLQFKQVLVAFEDAIPLGIKTASGELLLNPADSYVIGDGDEIIVLAEDDESYCASISHTLIRDIVSVDHSGRRQFVDICSGGLNAIQRFSGVFTRTNSDTLKRWSSGARGAVENCIVREKILFIGWRFDMGDMLQVYEAIAPPRSEFWILSELPIAQREHELGIRGWKESCGSHSLKVVHKVGASRRSILAELPLETFHSIMVGAKGSMAACASPQEEAIEVSMKRHDPVADADARVISTVLMVQDIITRRHREKSAQENFLDFTQRTSFSSENNALPRENSYKHSMDSARLFAGSCDEPVGPKRLQCGQTLAVKSTLLPPVPRRSIIVGEIVDSRSRAMLGVVNAIDAVVASNELISKALAMVSEDGSVNRLLNNLFDPYGSEITLERIDAYVDVEHGERANFFEVLMRGREFGTIVLGYLRATTHSVDSQTSSEKVGTMENHTISYEGVTLNPSDKDLRQQWHAEDLLIVLNNCSDALDSEHDSTSRLPSDFVNAAHLNDVTTSCDRDADSCLEFQGSDAADSTKKRSRIQFAI